MNKRLTKRIAGKLGLAMGNGSCHGNYKNFPTAIIAYKDCIVATISAGGAPDIVENAVERLKESLTETGKVEKVIYERNGFRFRLAGTDVEEFRKILDETVEELHRNALEPACCGCGVTGQEMDFYEINGKRDFLCSNCVKTICNDVKRKRVRVGNVSSSLFTGLVGALAGIHLGLFLWIVSTHFGFNGSIPATLMVIFMCIGYKTLGCSMDMKGVVLCSVLGVVYFLVGICFSFEHLVYLSYYGSLAFSYAETLRLVPLVLETMDAVNLKGFIVEDVCAFLTMLIVMAATLRVMYTRNRNGIVFRKM